MISRRMTGPPGERVRVRMGVHTGEASGTAATDLMGLDVHRAARVGALAYGGQVLLSETAAALVRDRLPPGAALADLGLHRLKDLGRPEEIFQLNAPGLQAEFPALRSLGNPALPNNLPAQLATFIGREQELADVRALAETSRLVTLTGAGGAGKTRLSLQVAAELLDGSGDGVWLVELAPVADEDEVAPTIAATLAIAGQPGRPILEALVDALVPQDVLIVLDNCEQVIGACAKAAEAILQRCPRVHVIATSREPLGIGGEVIYRVPSLSLPGPDGDAGVVTQESSDAVALLLQRAREQGVALPRDEETGRLLASICRQLDGMPLAIELAAARLRSMSLTDLRDRLDQRFRLLTGGSRTAMERQRTLHAMVDWSYSLLNTAEQLLLRRLSVFPETFELAAAEAVCGFGDIELIEVADLLGSLADKSLVVAEPAGSAVRYRLLETIRQFAAERLAETGEDEAAALATAHCDYFLRVAEAASSRLTGPDQGAWFARLDADQLNLWRAAEYAARSPDGTARVLRFGVALRRYWGSRPREAEVFELLASVLRRPEASADQALFTEALFTATFMGHTNDLEAASRFGDQAVAAARQLGDERLLIEALAAQCSSFYFLAPVQGGIYARAGGGCARPPARRRCAARQRPHVAADDQLRPRPRPVRPAVRRGRRVRQPVRRSAHRLPPAQQCRRSGAADRGHARGPGSPGTGAAGRPHDRRGRGRRFDQPGLGAACRERSRWVAGDVRNLAADRPPDRAALRSRLRRPRPGVPSR